MNYFQCQNLSKQLETKDVKESEIRSLNSIRGIAPKFNILKVNMHKIYSLHLYLLPQDVIYTIIVLAKTSSNPLYWLGLGHMFVDPYVVYVGNSMLEENSADKNLVGMLRIAYILLLASSLILFVLNIENESADVGDWLAFLFILVYACIDIVLFALSSEILSAFNQFSSPLYKAAINK